VCFTKPAFLVCPDSFSHQIELVTEILKSELWRPARFLPYPSCFSLFENDVDRERPKRKPWHWERDARQKFKQEQDKLEQEARLVAYFERNQLTDFDSSSVSVTSYALIEIP
jgi:hypothetical protein